MAPQNSYIETLTPKMTVFGSEIFEGQSDLDEVMRMVFLAVMYGYESWTIENAGHQRTDAFELCLQYLADP